ncbi:MAG: SCO1664 family protein [Actinomycetes bacterium]
MSVTDDSPLLLHGTIDVQGRLVDASNATLYCTVTLAGESSVCVYKPVSGERPLWDFPTGTLAARERATFLVSRAGGWDLVPPTVLRDGPFGPGMVQLWVDVDETVDLVALVRSRHPDLRQMAVLDAVTNNADRKGGHLLPTPQRRVLGIDHGVTFAVEDKLRTLLWQWADEPLDDASVEALSRLEKGLDAGALAVSLLGLLTKQEVSATRRRVQTMLDTGRHPQPPTDWPAIPWPPF